MASLSLKHVYKVYDGGVKAVNDFCMEIKDKEFIVFVGPSGCGKSTTLRMIAGLEEITAGELMIGDEVVNDMEPKDRNIAMVFQNYALYPHMTVRENMAFALKLRKDLSKAEIDAKVNEAARVLDISQFLERKPRALSGGQRQRVSLGRAIVRDPKVFLLDEPLSNLDAKLRAQMRTEITKLHHKLQTTFIYVTHDQVEAMTMGTRIVVMKLGIVQQIDTPQNLYRYPGNKFVAGFIGTPQMNFFDATLERLGGGKVGITFANNRKIVVPEVAVVKVENKYFDGKTVVTFGIRPEDIHIDDDFVAAHESSAFSCQPSIIEALGSESIVYCELDESKKDEISESSTRMVLKVDPRVNIEKDSTIKVAIDPERIHLFDNDTELTIMPRIPAANIIDGTVSGGILELFGKNFKLPPAIKVSGAKCRVSIPSDAIIFKNSGGQYDTVIDKKKEVYSEVSVPEKYAKTKLSNIAPHYGSDTFVVKEFPFSDGTNVKIAKVEKVSDTKLVYLDFNGHTVFAIGSEDMSDNVSETEITIDWKRVSFSYTDSETSALNLVNVLNGKLVKERVSSKEYNFALSLCGVNTYCTDYIRTKLFNAAARKVFDILLDFDFGVYDVMILNGEEREAVEGIVGVIENILDYGREKIAVCKVGDKAVNVYLRENAAIGETVKLALNIPALGIVEANRGIRII